MTDTRKHVTIYTDGGCDPNPGPGGYGVVLIYNNTRKELSGGFRATTNNRMELYAAIRGLEELKEPCRVTLHSDSQYLVHAMTKGWARKWQENNWWRTKKERAVNPDLWERLLAACDKHDVTFVWVRGHAGNTHNERCDRLAVQAAHQGNLPPDVGYEDASAPRDRLEAYSTLSERTEDSHQSCTVKITYEGQPCRKCGTPVVKKVPRKTPKKTQAYYYAYYFYCPQCKTMYMVEDAKRDNLSLC